MNNKREWKIIFYWTFLTTTADRVSLYQSSIINLLLSIQITSKIVMNFTLIPSEISIIDATLSMNGYLAVFCHLQQFTSPTLCLWQANFLIYWTTTTMHNLSFFVLCHRYLCQGLVNLFVSQPLLDFINLIHILVIFSAMCLQFLGRNF